MYKVVVTEKAEVEYENAYWFYEERQAGQGKRFQHEVGQLLKIIKEYPLLFHRKHKQFREALMIRFPYFIVYEIILKTVVVHSFFHTSKNPKKKYKYSKVPPLLLNEPNESYRKKK
jgi:plasmid stabilization system protein ParE